MRPNDPSPKLRRVTKLADMLPVDLRHIQITVQLDETINSFTPHQQGEAIARREAGQAVTEIARSYIVSHSTIARLAPNRRS